MRFIKLICFSLFLTFCLLSSVKADWVNYTGAEKSSNVAEFYITAKEIKLNLEISPQDLLSFKNFFNHKFSAKGHGLQIFADGKLLKGQVKIKEMRKRVDRQSPFPPTGNKKPSDKVVFVTVQYPLQRKPHILTFVAPRKNNLISANIGFVVYHNKVQVINFKHLPGKAILKLDWSDPWYSVFKHKNLGRFQNSAIMSFLYIDPYEVRHEMLLRVKDLQPWLSFKFANKHYLNPQDQQKIKAEIAKLFLKHNQITIDGKIGKPILDQVNFVNFSEKGVQVISKSTKIDLLTANVGVIIAYITDGIPQKVSIKWDMFKNNITTIPIITTDPVGPVFQRLSPSNKSITWINSLVNYKLPRIQSVVINKHKLQFKIPILSLCLLIVLITLLIIIRRRYIKAQPISKLSILAGIVLIGSIALYPIGNINVGHPFKPKLSQNEAKIVITHLLRNIYRAFDFRDEEAVYDKLNVSLNGDLLETIYLQQRHNMDLEKLGGAKAKVTELKLIKLSKLPDSSANVYTYRCEWTVTGTVGHWGHIHKRINKYDAILTLAPIGHVWQLTAVQPVAETRIK